jgi:predicted NACHT family NTPase
MGRSKIATKRGIKAANIALERMGWTQTELAIQLNMTRQPIGKFFGGKPVSNKFFIRICDALSQNWQDISGITEIHPESLSETPLDLTNDINILVETTRKAIKKTIKRKCGWMKVLDMLEPIELIGDNGIYTNVDILECPIRFGVTAQELPEIRSEILLGSELFKVGHSIKRRPGLDVVQKLLEKDEDPEDTIQKVVGLLVWGKPGSGKTTFLKYLAMHCITGRFAANKVPFFVTLKHFAEFPKSPNLLQYLARSVSSTQRQPFQERLGGINSEEIVEQLLQNGRGLILLDGLDEVRAKDTGRVIREISGAAEQFDQSRFVIACRIAAKEYVFQQFREVEVADFDKQQIKTFAKKWFQSKKDPIKAKNVGESLQKDERIWELASNPLLLTLLCLVFGESGKFPSRRSDLYKEGVKILLTKWDASRNIERDELYKSLDVQRRKDLLSSVAYQTFLQGNLVLRQRNIEGYIADFLQHLRDIDPDPEILRVDSEAVLQCIEAHHGLLVEVARNVYSFSHLTLHEYFAAREINLSNHLFDELTSKFSDRRWREVFLLTMEMLRDASHLLLKIKRNIDLQLAGDQIIQNFLHRVQEKSASVLTNYNPSALRAFYYSLSLNFDYELARKIDPNFDCDTSPDLKLDNALMVVLNRAVAKADIPMKTDFEDLLEIARDNNYELRNQLQNLYSRLPEEDDTQETIRWSETRDYQDWVRDLRRCMIDRSICSASNFTPEQKKLLWQYYRSNLFLWECLNSDCYVDRRVRENIEHSFLIPQPPEFTQSL